MLLPQQSSSLRIALIATGAALLLLLVFGVRSGYMQPNLFDLAQDTHLAVDESVVLQDVYNQTLGVSMQPPQLHAHC